MDMEALFETISRRRRPEDVAQMIRVPLNPPQCLNARNTRSVTKAATICDRAFEQSLRPRAELAMLPYQSRRHLRVAVSRLAHESSLLKLAGVVYFLTDFGRPLGRLLSRQFADFNGGHVNVDVNAVEQRAGDF